MTLYLLSFAAGFAGARSGQDLTGVCLFAGFFYHLTVSFLANAWLESALTERGWKLSP